jgi:hypothetical protein
MRRTIIAVAAIAIVVIGIIGYAAAGFAYAQTRVGNADRTLSAVISHQNSLNTTFSDINTKFKALSSSASVDPQQASTLFDQFVATAKSAGTTADQDDTSLVSAKASLREQQWLTVFSRNSLDSEAARIDHARNALTSAKTLAADYVRDGELFQAYFNAATDVQTFSAQGATADYAAARATLTAMKTQVDKALQLSTAPGLPSDLHDLMVDFESLIIDFGKLLDAAAGSDDATIIRAEKGVETDANKINTYSLDKILAEVGASYKPLLDSVSSEMAKATA